MHRFLVADDHSLLREGIENVLRTGWPGCVVQHALDGPEALALLLEDRFDLAILDIGMPLLDGLEVLARARKAGLRIPILIVSMHPEERMGVRALRCGASGYLTKDAAPSSLTDAVSALLAGRKSISPRLADLLAEAVQGAAEPPAAAKLSGREFHVLRMLSSGKSLREISASMSLSIKTVHTYRTRLLNKLGLKRTGELVRLGVEQGLAEGEPGTGASSLAPPSPGKSSPRNRSDDP
ncbi:MAG: response regulator transcription factor [Fibrobacteria bacterium]|nr:response regulator transcription factor [Fibrobacteria bacterium]